MRIYKREKVRDVRDCCEREVIIVDFFLYCKNLL